MEEAALEVKQGTAATLADFKIVDRFRSAARQVDIGVFSVRALRSMFNMREV
jgi:hypothetical protein